MKRRESSREKEREWGESAPGLMSRAQQSVTCRTMEAKEDGRERKAQLGDNGSRPVCIYEKGKIQQVNSRKRCRVEY